MPRQPAAPVDPLFIERWSTRAFSPEPLEPGTLATLFEAARWAPSCFNEQPWLFRYADSEPDLTRFRSALGAWNRQWADAAPVLVFVLAARQFARSGKPNRWAGFDAGAAWMSLALQARMLGLHTHAMGGFDLERAAGILDVDGEVWDILAAVALGRRGEPADLPQEIATLEAVGPSDRKPVDEVARRG